MSYWDQLQNFSASEFTCQGEHCCGGMQEMREDFMRQLQHLRSEYGKPMIITSGWRCPEHNQNVSSTGPAGPHTTGRAIDCAIKGADAFELMGIADEFGMTGVGLKQHGDHAKRFIHLDNLLDHETEGPRPWVWTYK